MKRVFILLVFLVSISCVLYSQTTSLPEELSSAKTYFELWFGEKVSSPSNVFPGSLTIGEIPANHNPEEWIREITTEKGNDKITCILKLIHIKTGLVVRYKAVQYLHFPVLEWTAYYKNESNKKTPILQELKTIDTVFPEFKNQQIILHRNKGDNCSADSYEPIDEPMNHGSEINLANTGGRPTQTTFPYFNFQKDDGGLIFVISWAGQWSCRFYRDTDGSLHIQGGQELTHFNLYPGEEVRGPMVVLLFYSGDKHRGQNLWRQWMIHCNLPKQDGTPPKVPMLLSCSATSVEETYQENTESHKMLIQKYIDRGFQLDYWWIDAGWYPCDRNWPKTGTWVIDETRFPGGFKPISDFAHSRNIKLLVWFEPERVHAGTWLAENHPEWILGGEQGGLLNLGNAEARDWLTNYIDNFLTKEGIDLYRQDFNIDPLEFWRKNDTPDRQGITEIQHVEGYFAYWDELLRRHPNMLIDSCASGGRRNDLETLRRAVPLLRSDYIMEPIGNQCHTWALSEWIPFNGTGTSKTSIYEVMSVFTSSFTACWNQRDDTIDWAILKRLIDDRCIYGECYYGDYYPLTPYSLKPDTWIAWQFNLQSKGKGFVQVFRREQSETESMRLPLYGLELDTKYHIASPSKEGQSLELTGKELTEHGVPITLPEKPSAICLVYEKMKG